MDRLTKHYGEDNTFALEKTTGDFTIDNYNAICKLGKLEDLEEELGCPLEVYIKLEMSIDAEIYTLDEYTGEMGYVEYRGVIFNFNDKGIKHSLYVRSEMHTTWDLDTRDYKKTWWLKEDRSE